MGICSSSDSLPQVLIVGLDSAGKTTFLYADKWDNFEPTYGFNYEEIRLRGIVQVAVWDLPGKSTLRCLWPTVYKNIKFKAVVFVVDADKPDRFYEARKELHVLVNEEELRDASFLIVFNSRSPEIRDLPEIVNRVGVDMVHPLVNMKSVVVDLMQEDQDFQDAMIWLCQMIEK
jgi:GTPase SAR1 family protein